MNISNRSRINKARRFFKKAPIFAFQELQALLGDEYTFEQFLGDLKLKTKPKRKAKKSGLVRYGRYGRMMQLVSIWRSSGDISFLIEAQQLRDRISQPYRLQVRYGREIKEYYYPPEVPINHLEAILELTKVCSSHAQFEEMKLEKEKYRVF